MTAAKSILSAMEYEDKRMFTPKRLRIFRELRGLSVSKVAELMPGAKGRAVQPITIRSWERGHGEPRGSDLIALVRILNVDLDDFYEVPV